MVVLAFCPQLRIETESSKFQVHYIGITYAQVMIKMNLKYLGPSIATHPTKISNLVTSNQNAR